MKVECDRLKEFADKFREVKVQTSRKRIVNTQYATARGAGEMNTMFMGTESQSRRRSQEARPREARARKLGGFLIQEGMILKEEVLLELIIGFGIGLGCRVMIEDLSQVGKVDSRESILGQDLDWETLREVNHGIERIEEISQVRITKGTLTDVLHASAIIVKSY